MTPRRFRLPGIFQQGRNDGPPDLNEVWERFNRQLSGLFGGKRPPPPPEQPGSGGEPPQFQPDLRHAGTGAMLVGAAVLAVWALSGVFIVQEGEQAVVTTFGKYSRTVDAGLQWRMPYPIQRHETIPVTQLRSVEVGDTSVVPATGLRDSSMLTEDENIVDLRFTVQYTLNDARAFLYENRNTEMAVKLAAESAVREIVGKSRVDDVLYERRDAIAADLVKSIQAQVDRLKAGVQVRNVNLQSVQVPEQVQAAFDDAVKAGADRDRLKNEGEAYASDVVPRAQGQAARLNEEAKGYASRVVATAEGDAQRFASVVAEYQKAPAVTRDRLYTDTMREVYANVSKVMVESRSGNNLLYLPLDQLIKQTAPSGAQQQPAPAAAPDNLPAAGNAAASEARARDAARSRDREGR